MKKTIKIVTLTVLGLAMMAVSWFNIVFHVSLISAMLYGEKYGIASPKNKGMPVLGTTFEEFKEFFIDDTVRTELQRNAIFDQYFKNQRIKWTGTVAEVDRKMFGDKIFVGVKHTDRRFGYDVKLNMRNNIKDQLDALADLNVGDKITYTGRVYYYGRILPTIINKGIILKIN